MKFVAKWLALLGPAGLSPVAPATAGSALVTIIAWYLPVPAFPVFLGLFAVGTLVAVWAAGEAEKELGHDAKPICIDEAVGQTLSLMFVPHTIAAFATAFVLFRIFDVWKPLGAHKAQDLPGGWGVVADDFIAGLVTFAVMQGVLWVARYYGVTLLG